jgi:hypothetical protein
MENGKKLEFPEGQEGVRVNQGFPLHQIKGGVQRSGGSGNPSDF